MNLISTAFRVFSLFQNCAVFQSCGIEHASSSYLRWTCIWHDMWNEWIWAQFLTIIENTHRQSNSGFEWMGIGKWGTLMKKKQRQKSQFYFTKLSRQMSSFQIFPWWDCVNRQLGLSPFCHVFHLGFTQISILLACQRMRSSFWVCLLPMYVSDPLQ